MEKKRGDWRERTAETTTNAIYSNWAGGRRRWRRLRLFTDCDAGTTDRSTGGACENLCLSFCVRIHTCTYGIRIIFWIFLFWWSIYVVSLSPYISISPTFNRVSKRNVKKKKNHMTMMFVSHAGILYFYGGDISHLGMSPSLCHTVVIKRFNIRMGSLMTYWVFPNRFLS